MAFKMKGMSFGKGTSYKSPQAMKKESAMKMAKKDSAMNMAKKSPMDMAKKSPMTKTQAQRAAERLAEKAKRLKEKGASERRIANVENKKARKEKIAKNIEAGKTGLRERRANTRKTVDRNIVKTDKKFNEKGIKSEVTRTNKATGTTVTKKKSGTGVNKTVQKTVTKPKNVAKKKELTFGQAFAAARKAGKKTFTYKGKPYHTRTKEENKNFVDKKKGVQGPQTKEAQNYEDKQGKVPFKKSSPNKLAKRTVTKGRREGAPKNKYKTVEYADKTGKVVRSKTVAKGPTGRKVTKRQGDIYSDIVKQKVKQRYPQNKK
jgi:hypothetical protein